MGKLRDERRQLQLCVLFAPFFHSTDFLERNEQRNRRIDGCQVKTWGGWRVLAQLDTGSESSHISLPLRTLNAPSFTPSAPRTARPASSSHHSATHRRRPAYPSPPSLESRPQIHTTGESAQGSPRTRPRLRADAGPGDRSPQTELARLGSVATCVPRVSLVSLVSLKVLMPCGA